MPVQAGAEAVDVDLGICQGHCADVHGRLVQLRRTGAVGLQALHNDPQEDAQPLRDGEHPLAHRQPGEDVVRQMRGRLHHAPCVA